MPARGLYLSIGLTYREAQYDGLKPLTGCVNDAKDIASIAEGEGFEGTILLNDAATAYAVLERLQQAAQDLADGDILLVYFSGHGGFVPDSSGDETDALDETWCLYDRQLMDDELYAIWAQFRSGVRIFVLSDSCHSGSAVKHHFAKLEGRRLNLRLQEDVASAIQFALSHTSTSAAPPQPEPEPEIKALQFPDSWADYENNKPLYDELQKMAGPSEKNAAEVAAGVILISGCQDDEKSYDGSPNSEFTRALKRAWAKGAFKGNYSDFCKAIKANGLRPNQNPNYLTVGTPNPVFENERPFSI